MNLPPLRELEASLREITSGDEPETYEERRDILEGLLDLRVTYADGELEITGQVPYMDPAAAATPKDGKKNCYSRLGADSQRQREDHHQAQQRGLRQTSQSKPNSRHVLNTLEQPRSLATF